VLPERVVLVCAGTEEFPALEDILCAGALCDQLSRVTKDDAAEVAHRTFRDAQGDLLAAVARSRNGKRLLANPALRADVEFCLRRDACNFSAILGADGMVRRMD